MATTTAGQITCRARARPGGECLPCRSAWSSTRTATLDHAARAGLQHHHLLQGFPHRLRAARRGLVELTLRAAVRSPVMSLCDCRMVGEAFRPPCSHARLCRQAVLAGSRRRAVRSRRRTASAPRRIRPGGDSQPARPTATRWRIRWPEEFFAYAGAPRPTTRPTGDRPGAQASRARWRWPDPQQPRRWRAWHDSRLILRRLDRARRDRRRALGP